jgi:transcriptional regulator with XRE-family HTH domain
MSLAPERSRAARGLLDWSQAELASRSNLSESTIRDFEKGRRVPSVNNLAAIQRALESAGVEFTNGDQPGVRMKAGYRPAPAAKPEFTPFDGKEGIQIQVGHQRRPRPRSDDE